MVCKSHEICNFAPGMYRAFIHKVIRIWVLASLLVLSFTGIGQQRQNPFEVKPRLKNIRVQDTVRTQPAVVPALVRDTLTPPMPADSLAATRAEEKRSDINNPFEVDHVPQKKSSIAKRSEKMKEQAEATKTSNGFIFWFLLLACGLLAIVINTSQKAIGLIYKAILNENVLKLLQREESTKASSYLVLLYIIFTINLGVFAYLCVAHFGGPRGITVLLLFLAAVAVIYMIRHAGLAMCGKIFMVEKQTSLYSFTVMLFNQFVGILLIPANFLLAFGPLAYHQAIIWICLIILGMLIFLRTVRGIFIASEFLTDRIFQIFIYLCAFEIAPMLILIKTAMNLGH